jgi:hypothetical protein
MALQVVGAGFGRTGTNSLKLALEQLGFAPCHHMFEVRDHPEQLADWQALARGETVDWDEVFAGYKAAVDWPSARYWRELAAYYSEAKVILSVRPADKWFKSVHNTIYPAMMTFPDLEEGDTRARLKMGHDLVIQGAFDGRMDDRDHAVGVFEAHIADVQRSIPAERLLTYDVAKGWAPLCGFLGVPVPDTPFPHTNTTEQFQQAVAQRSQMSEAT